ncbi:hypothetical protein B0H14DRAFT_646278 [Mycena olivaceomarginata]|nr:hypothetical protein B0H14DRAFT_646278 [Mycena olivaceomarginata]
MPIPWLNLILVCKLISSELQHHLQASTNTTYKLEVNNLKLELSQGITDKVTWRQVPCSPSEVRTIQAELVLDWMTQFWNDGGPLLILSALYQALNCFIHYGPLLSRESPLGKHIHLDTLIVQIRAVAPKPDERLAKMQKRLCRLLQRYISVVVERGVLSGAVDKIVCRAADDDGDVIKWDVRRKPIGDMTEWNRYQFNWGVPGSSSLEASGVLLPSQSDAPGEH